MLWSCTFMPIFMLVCIQEPRCYDALAELYATLDEEDMLHGLWKMCAVMPETKHAVAWAQHGQMDVAQESLTNALERSKNPDGESLCYIRFGKQFRRYGNTQDLVRKLASRLHLEL